MLQFLQQNGCFADHSFETVSILLYLRFALVQDLTPVRGIIQAS